MLNVTMVPQLSGKPIKFIRVVNSSGTVIPFQVDEITEDDEYICDQGNSPNTEQSNGVFDSKDEIVFLLEDCIPGKHDFKNSAAGVTIVKSDSVYTVSIVSDSTLPLSSKKYIEYDHGNRLLKTPFFYAQFANDRFHFERAGVASKNSTSYFDLTAELSVEIKMKALFGLLPIHYTENNLVCFVKRWKVGAIRLIRRGDFHLNLGLGLKGSKAAVNQICYPQLVKVPVLLHIPVRFGTLFKDAYVEMAPVIKKNAISFHYSVMQKDISWNLDSTINHLDTIIPAIPCNTLMSVNDDSRGYGWILQTSIPENLLSGSGILFRKPSVRSGLADCGYHLSIDDVDKGYYDITNWVIFPDINNSTFTVDYQSISAPSKVTTSAGIFDNLICAQTPARKQKAKK